MAAATAIVGGAVGVAKFFEGRSMQRDAQKAIDNFQWQELKNPFENQQVSTLGTDLMTEQANLGAASNTEALRTGGTRALVAGLGRVEAARNNVNREAAANLDMQQKEINKNIAAQEVANQNMVEKRQADELAGYGQQLNVGMGLKYQGLSNVVNAVGTFGQAMQGGANSQNAPVEGVNQLQPMGAQPSSGAASLSNMALPMIPYVM